MIIPIPENKIIKHNISTKKLNESFWDDDMFDETNSLINDLEIEDRKRLEEQDKEKVELTLQQLDVENYEIKCTGCGILVDVHDNLFLPNKKLNRFTTNLFKFNIVDGNCNFTNNGLTNWSFFPNMIKGNCYANFNNLKNFKGAPQIIGKIYATKQNKKTDYPLTQENYLHFQNNEITENSVYAIPVNRFGTIYSICEEDYSCIIKFKDNSKQKFKLNEVECLESIENLLI